MQLNRRKGFVIMDVVFAAVLLGIAIGAYSMATIFYRRALNRINVQGYGVDAMNLMREILDCGNTFRNTGTDPNLVSDCTSATKQSARFIEIQDSMQTAIVQKFTNESSAQVMGKMRIRARCVWQNGFHGILFENRALGDDNRADVAERWRFLSGEVPFACR